MKDFEFWQYVVEKLSEVNRCAWHVQHAGKHEMWRTSRFIDLPKVEGCKDLAHEPPTHLCIPQGKCYIHVCPRCGAEKILMPPQVSL